MKNNDRFINDLKEQLKKCISLVGLKIILDHADAFSPSPMQIDELPTNFCQGLIVLGTLDTGAFGVSFLETDSEKRVPPVLSIRATTKIFTRKNSTGDYPFVVTIDNPGEQSRILRITDIEMMRRYARAFRMLIQKVKELTP